MRKTREHSVVLACIMVWLRHFTWVKKFVFFFAWKETLFCFRQWHDNGFAVTWQRDCGWNLFATTWQFLKLGTLLRRGWWNLFSWNAGWWYSRGAKTASTWSLLPYNSLTYLINLLTYLFIYILATVIHHGTIPRTRYFFHQTYRGAKSLLR